MADILYPTAASNADAEAAKELGQHRKLIDAAGYMTLTI